MILGYKIFENTLESIDFDKNKIINTINPHSYCLSGMINYLMKPYNLQTFCYQMVRVLY